MNIEDIYYDFPELMTPEEKEDRDFEEYDDQGNCLVELLSYPRWFMDHCMYLPRPEADSRTEFERRKPALGLSQDKIQQLRDYYNDPRLLPVQKRSFASYLKHQMMRQLICTDGCQTVEELFAILQADLDSNIPAAVPDWYKYSTITHGPRDTGYYQCQNRGCYHTDTLERKIAACSRCKLARYCCKKCQQEDWSARHKKICKKAKEKRDMTAQAGSFIQMFR